MFTAARNALIRVIACLTMASTAAQAQSTDAPPDPRAAVFDEARRAAQAGPVDLPLAGKDLLKLPAGHAFIPQPQAGRLLQAMGNPGKDERLLGLIFPQTADEQQGGWFMTVRYEDSGHIADDEARDWNADDLLKNYREGTEASNEERRKMGAAAIEVLGWAEKPSYEASSHRLQWAMASREKGAAADQPQGVNYNTYVLGREGYFTMNLVTALAQLAQHKPAAQALLQALSFNEGQRYADFSAGTDRMAEYGLAALVVGVAAKKLGLIALGGLFFAKFAKIILVALALLGGGAARFFKRKPKADAAVPPAAPPAPPAA
jgi:uncharacterized membrane-anchored protein